jgi:hypothetical protein
VRSGRMAAIPCALLVLLSSPARASLGGPLTVRILGWDPSTERIYVEQVGHDESGERNCTFYYDLRTPDPARPHVVPASRLVFPPDTTGMSRGRRELQLTLAGLKSMPRDDEGVPSILDRCSVLERRTLQPSSFGEKVERYLVEVRGLEGATSSDTIRVTAYRDPRVQTIHRYRIPGRSERLIVLSCLGMPFESMYEVQQCVLVGAKHSGIQRLDSTHGVLH